MAKWPSLALAAPVALLSIALTARAQDLYQHAAQSQGQSPILFDNAQRDPAGDPRLPDGLLSLPNKMALPPELVQPPSTLTEKSPEVREPLPELANPLAKQAEPAPSEAADQVLPKLIQPDLELENWGSAVDGLSCTCDACDCEDCYAEDCDCEYCDCGQCDRGDCDCESCECSVYGMSESGCECRASRIGKHRHRLRRPLGKLFSKHLNLFQDHGRHHPWSGFLGPLYATSWLNRPYHASVFVGGLIGDDLLPGRVERDTDAIGGLRLGWDFDHYWGGEIRLAFAEPRIRNRLDPPNTRTIRFFQTDANIACYPFGDTVWRPYATVGVGVTALEFDDEAMVHRGTSLLTVPVGGGLKFMQRPWLIYRAEIVDSIAFSNEVVDTLHNVSFTLSIEFRFGGKRRSYYPWAPERNFW